MAETRDEIPLDQVSGAPHPRTTLALRGQGAAEAEFCAAHRNGRLHHAWLLHGPRGVGKATLAYRIARFLLAGGGTEEGGLELPAEHPVTARVAAGGERRLRTLCRNWNRTGSAAPRPYTEIRVDDVRNASDLFRYAALNEGWRILIVDPAEEMNPNAANALLKILEEPPHQAILLLVSHAPRRLLPTILSRCRRLAVQPLESADFAAALTGALGKLPQRDIEALERASDGSPGEAARLHLLGGAELTQTCDNLLATLPNLDRNALVGFVNGFAKREHAPRLELAANLLERALAAHARRALESSPGTARAALWADAAGTFRSGFDRARATNLDPARTLLTAFVEIETMARRAEKQG